MAQFIPKRDETLEADPHQKWLEKGHLNHEARIAALEKLALNGTATNRQTVQSSQTASGVPTPAFRGSVLRGNDMNVLWSREWQGLMPEYWVSLDAAGGSYFVTKVGLADDATTDSARSKAVLPPVVFDDGGLTMLPIETVVGSIKVHSPFHLYVDLNPSFEGEEFTIYLPPFDNGFGPSSPFYSFKLENIGAYGAVVNIVDTDLIYEGTLEPVLGDVDTWAVGVGFSAAWSVRNVLGGGAMATPAAFWNGSAVEFADDYYTTNVYTP